MILGQLPNPSALNFFSFQLEISISTWKDHSKYVIENLASESVVVFSREKGH